MIILQGAKDTVVSPIAAAKQWAELLVNGEALSTPIYPHEAYHEADFCIDPLSCRRM